jgi:hypothetical protein
VDLNGGVWFENTCPCGGSESGAYTTHPSRRLMIRFPYAAFVSLCVTWMIVVPC